MSTVEQIIKNRKASEKELVANTNKLINSFRRELDTLDIMRTLERHFIEAAEDTGLNLTRNELESIVQIELKKVFTQEAIDEYNNSEYKY